MRPRSSTLWMLVAVSLLTLSGVAAVQAVDAQLVVFDSISIEDTAVDSTQPAQALGSSAVLWVSQDGALNANWSLLAFSLSGTLRPGDRIVEARMNLVVLAANGLGAIALRTARILTPWSERNTTWESRPNLVFDTSTTSEVPLTPFSGTTVSVDVTKQLQRWHSYGGPSNYGTAILMDPASGHAAVALASRENPAENPPTLRVTYHPSPRAVYGYSLSPMPSVATWRSD